MKREARLIEQAPGRRIVVMYGYWSEAATTQMVGELLQFDQQVPVSRPTV
jgi:hypothetical protein